MARVKAVVSFSVRAGAAVLALACAAGALAAQGGRVSDRLDALTHFAPLWLAGGLVAALLRWSIGRRDGGFVTLALAGMAVASSLVLMAPELAAKAAASRSPARGETLKLIQFNVWDHNGEPERTVAWIMAQKPDVLVVEEASNDSRVRELLEARFSQRTTCAEPYPCSTTLFYNRPPLAEAGYMKTDGTPMYLAAAWATLPDPGGPFTVIGTHHTWPVPPGPQQVQSRRLAEVVNRYDHRSLIVAGDFNSTPWSFSLQRQDRLFGLERRTRALATWPAAPVTRYGIRTPFPLLPIDQVYAGEGWRTVSVKRGPRLGSDHYPVVVVLERVSPGAPSKAGR